jgi:hypothetical protein
MHAVWADQDPDVLPELVWRRSGGKAYSSGHCSLPDAVTHRCRIVVTAGRGVPRWEQKMVLLHELAHAICPPGEHHGELFWTTAWRLYRRFNLPIRKVRFHEDAYRKTAHLGYLASRLSRDAG